MTLVVVDAVGLSPERAVIYVNNRRLMESEFDALGILPEKRLDVSNLIDCRTKMEPARWDEYALEIGLNETQRDGLKTVLANYDLWQKSEELSRLFAALEVLGARDYLKFDPNIMRGLLYYTGTVFEAFETSGSVKRAILGGGRYDNLLADVGGTPLSGMGFAMGDVVLGIVLQEAGLLGISPVAAAPRIEILGLYPTLEGLAAQAATLVVAGFAVALMVVLTLAAPEAAQAQPPSDPQAGVAPDPVGSDGVAHADVVPAADGGDQEQVDESCGGPFPRRDHRLPDHRRLDQVDAVIVLPGQTLGQLGAAVGRAGVDDDDHSAVSCRAAPSRRPGSARPSASARSRPAAGTAPSSSRAPSRPASRRAGSCR